MRCPAAALSQLHRRGDAPAASRPLVRMTSTGRRPCQPQPMPCVVRRARSNAARNRPMAFAQRHPHGGRRGAARARPPARERYDPPRLRVPGPERLARRRPPPAARAHRLGQDGARISGGHRIAGAEVGRPARQRGQRRAAASADSVEIRHGSNGCLWIRSSKAHITGRGIRTGLFIASVATVARPIGVRPMIAPVIDTPAEMSFQSWVRGLNKSAIRWVLGSRPSI